MPYDARTRRSPNGSQQLTVSTVAVSLTVPAGSDFATIRCSTNNVRYRDDGTAPTSAVGVPLLATEILNYDGTLPTIQFIRSGAADATLDILYYK